MKTTVPRYAHAPNQYKLILQFEIGFKSESITIIILHSYKKPNDGTTSTRFPLLNFILTIS